MNKNEEIIPVVDYEIVEEIPDNSYAVPVVDPEDISETAVPAPDPSTLRQGYFTKGGRGHGRKRIFQTPEEMEAACMEYFSGLMVATFNGKTGKMEYVWQRSPSMSGLARAIGMTYETLRVYGHNEEFSEVVDWARDVLREYYETGVNGPGNPVGKIFMLKNLGYSDNMTYTFAPPSRLQAAQSPDEIAKLVADDIV